MSKSTAYNLIAEALREHILGGKYQPGQQLPTERELCEQFAASRITIRRAIQILEEELLVNRRQGSGTFITPTPTRKIPILNTGYFDSVARYAPALKRRLDHHEWRTADPEVADTLGIIAGDDVYFARRIDELEGSPVAMDELFLPRRYAGKLTSDDLLRLDFIECWSRAQGVTVDYFAQTVEAAAASEPIAAFLQVPEGSPVLIERDIIHTAEGRVGGLVVSYYRHQYFRLHSVVRPKTGKNRSSSSSSSAQTNLTPEVLSS